MLSAIVVSNLGVLTTCAEENHGYVMSERERERERERKRERGIEKEIERERMRERLRERE